MCHQKTYIIPPPIRRRNERGHDRGVDWSEREQPVEHLEGRERGDGCDRVVSQTAQLRRGQVAVGQLGGRVHPARTGQRRWCATDRLVSES